MKLSVTKRVDDVTLRELASLLAYDPETGALTWTVKPRFSVEAGLEAGWIRKDGYRYICFKGKRHIAHRVCWLLHTGSMPDGFCIDHINGEKSDNRISNLRLATQAQNLQNRGPLPSNTSGYKGVSFNRRRGKFLAAFKCDGAKHEVGFFETAEAAARAYDVAARKVHGEFAYLNFPAALAPATEGRKG